jgi:hypothetical protein
MKLNQAWGWLMAGVLAAGLNASYHDGGLQWAHQLADRVGNSSEAVVALATGQTDRFLSEVQLVSARSETASCPLTAAIARVQSALEGREGGTARLDAMAARQQVRLDKLEANRDRMETRIEAQTARIRVATAAFTPAVFKSASTSVICPRIRVNVPQVPMVRMPAMPVVHVDVASADPL